jgi:TolA-binding protein
VAQVESREAIALQNQMAELRRDVAQLREQIGRGGGAQPQGGTTVFANRPGPQAGGAEITTQLLDRVSAMEEAMRRLNGRMDEAENARTRAEAELAKQIADLQYRLDNPTGAPPPRPPAKPAEPVQSPPGGSLGTLPATPPPTSPVKRTPELALQEGNAALARQNYPAAEAAAKEVLGAGKGSPRAYDAQFLLAQALAGQRKPVDAAVAFGDSYNAAKQGTHAQDALIGYATNLTAIGEKKAACDTLDILRSQFPTPRADIGPKASAARTAAGCR